MDRESNQVRRQQAVGNRQKKIEFCRLCLKPNDCS
jgi:hypothetical protein